MVVMLMFVVMLIVRAPVTEAHFTSQTGIRQKPQRSVNGSLSNGWILFADQPMEIVSRKVALRAQKDFKNKIALRGTLQAFLLNVLQENFLLFSHRLCITPQVLFGLTDSNTQTRQAGNIDSRAIAWHAN